MIMVKCAMYQIMNGTVNERHMTILVQMFIGWNFIMIGGMP
jgi:hypothetical protein